MSTPERAAQVWARGRRLLPRDPQPQDDHRVRLLRGGDELFPAMTQAIDAARREVLVETYILEPHGKVLEVLDALLEAARRGVRVRVLVDGVGTPALPDPWPQRMSDAGVALAVHKPLGRVGLMLPSRWRRLHRKLCVVDGALGFCGGINLIDDWQDERGAPLLAARFDFAVQVQGPLVLAMAREMGILWRRQDVAQLLRQRRLGAAWQRVRGSASSADGAAAADPGAAVSRAAPDGDARWVEGVRAALLLRDNLRRRHVIERAYLQAIAQAQQEVLLANAYLVPGHRLLRALRQARERGVRVRLLLQGKYENFWQYHAARPVYARLLKYGVEIAEYAPSALHAKVAVIDGCWATVGSSNLDPISLLLAREANVVLRDERLATDLHTVLLQAWEGAGDHLSAATLAARPWRQRVLDRVAYLGMRLALWLTGHRY